jgi:hypothetical protein
MQFSSVHFLKLVDKLFKKPITTRRFCSFDDIGAMSVAIDTVIGIGN